MENLQKAETHATHGFSQFELSKKVLNNLYKYNLKPVTKLVLLFLCDCYNPKHGEMFPKQSTIAQKLGVSEVSVIRAISELHKEGLIISERKYTNRYSFTSRILSEPPINEQNKMRVQAKQKDSSKPIKKIAPCIEQKRETKKSTNIEDYKILKKYADKRGAKNIQAYINALIKSGSAESIIKEYKQIQANAQGMIGKAQRVQKDLEFARANRAENVPSDFFEKVKSQIKNSVIQQS